jgi:hypothetical protein
MKTNLTGIFQNLLFHENDTIQPMGTAGRYTNAASPLSGVKQLIRLPNYSLTSNNSPPYFHPSQAIPYQICTGDFSSDRGLYSFLKQSI